MATSCPACCSESIISDFTLKEWLGVNRASSSPLKRFTDLVQEQNGYGIEEMKRCKSCGFRFADPYPSDENLNHFYHDYYATKDYGAKLEKKLKRARRRIRRLVRGKRYANFLDVGCNVGTAVEAARQCNLQTTGIDIDPQAVEKAKTYFPKNSFETVTAQEFSAGGQCFDIVYCAEVIEHLNDIDAFTFALAQLTKPEGVLYLTTPDGGHFRTPRDIRLWNE